MRTVQSATGPVVAILVISAVGLFVANADRPGPTVPPGPFFGIDVTNGDLAAVGRVRSRTDHRPTVLNLFVKLDSVSFSVAKLDRLHAAGLTPMVTLEPWSLASRHGEVDPAYRLEALIDGRYDRELHRIASVIRAYGRPIYLRFAHEMNGSWYPWAVGENGNTASEYVEAWRHVWRLFTFSGDGEVYWLWSPNVLLRHQSVATYRRAFPGRSYVDAVGLTAYGHGSSADATIDASLSALNAVFTGPVILSETGADGVDKRAWIRSFGPFVLHHRSIAGFIWFDTVPAHPGSRGDYRFDDTSTDQRAFNATLSMARVQH